MPQILGHTWRLIRINQLTIYVESSCFVAIFAWIAFLMLFPALRGLPCLFLPLGLYISILGHELGHVLAARYHRMDAHAITLHAFGGYSKINGHYQHALQLLEVSLAGALIHLLIFITLSLLLRISSTGLISLIIEQLRWINLILGFGTLLPVISLDGGYVAQAVHWKVTEKLSLRLPWLRPEIGNGVGLISLIAGLYCISQSIIGLGMGLITLGLWMGTGYSTRKSSVQIQRGSKK